MHTKPLHSERCERIRTQATVRETFCKMHICWKILLQSIQRNFKIPQEHN